jgi:hypothetical protein
MDAKSRIKTDLRELCALSTQEAVGEEAYK